MWTHLVLMIAMNPGCDLKLARAAQTAYHAGQYAEAEAAFRHLSAQDCGAAQTIANWSSLGSTLRARSQFEESERWFRQAMSAAERQLLPTDPVWAQLLNSYALLEDELGRAKSAESKFRRALAAHPEAANIRTNLARLYTRLGRLEEASKLQQSALETEDGSPAQWINLALIRRKQGRNREAERLLRQGIERARARGGDTHPDTIAAQSNLAQIMIARGDRRGAARLMGRNIELFAQTYGKRHPEYAKLVSNLAALHFEQKNYAQAGRLFEEAMEINRAVLGEGHFDVARSAHDLGAWHHVEHRYEEAERFYQRALDIYAHQPEPSRERIDTLMNLGALYQQKKQPERAEPYYRELLTLVPGAIPSEEARMGKALEAFEHLLRERKEAVDAERVAMLSMRLRVREAIRREKDEAEPTAPSAQKALTQRR